MIGLLLGLRTWPVRAVRRDPRPAPALDARPSPACWPGTTGGPRTGRGPYGALPGASTRSTATPSRRRWTRTKRESGLDDSPMYDEAGYDPVTHNMDLADAGLNALHVADAEACSRPSCSHFVLEGDDATAGPADRRRGRARLGHRREAVLGRRRAGLPQRPGCRRGSHDPHVSPTLLWSHALGFLDEAGAARVADALLAPGILGGDRLAAQRRPQRPPASPPPTGAAASGAPMAYLAVQGCRCATTCATSAAPSALRPCSSCSSPSGSSTARSGRPAGYPAFDNEDLDWVPAAAPTG